VCVVTTPPHLSAVAAIVSTRYVFRHQRADKGMAAPQGKGKKRARADGEKKVGTWPGVTFRGCPAAPCSPPRGCWGVVYMCFSLGLLLNASEEQWVYSAIRDMPMIQDVCTSPTVPCWGCGVQRGKKELSGEELALRDAVAQAMAEMGDRIRCAAPPPILPHSPSLAPCSLPPPPPPHRPCIPPLLTGLSIPPRFARRSPVGLRSPAQSLSPPPLLLLSLLPFAPPFAPVLYPTILPPSLSCRAPSHQWSPSPAHVSPHPPTPPPFP
jgi:hypothetical protein